MWMFCLSIDNTAGQDAWDYRMHRIKGMIGLSLEKLWDSLKWQAFMVTQELSSNQWHLTNLVSTKGVWYLTIHVIRISPIQSAGNTELLKLEHGSLDWRLLILIIPDNGSWSFQSAIWYRCSWSVNASLLKIISLL